MIEVLRDRVNRLIQWFYGQERVIVALSGGVDSSVVAAIAKLALGSDAIAITVKSTMLLSSDYEDSVKVADFIKIRHLIIEYDELSNPRVTENQPDRCYFCRSDFISILKRVASSEGIKLLVDGTNADDLKVHRAGFLALCESGVRSPLAECGFIKEEVREVARTLNLPNSEKPSNACLASRIPYGRKITLEGLKRVSESERIVKELINVKQLRVRDHGDIARIEVGKEERIFFFDEKLLDMIVVGLKPLGFKYITFDLEGYRTGSLDEILP